MAALRDKSGNPLELTLYKYDSCGYCRRVMRVIDDKAIPVRYRDTLDDPQARRELIDVGGKSQVPCLVINGRPMYESADIIAYLENDVELG